MKSIKKIAFAAVAALFVLSACNKEDDLSINTIEGSYVGTLSGTGSLKSAETWMTSATADVVKTSEGEIQVHCFGDEIDTTFMLNYFENHDSLMVCLEGEAFEEMYGHMNSGGMMGGSNGGMMGGMNGTDWQNHMSSMHQEGDEHFGGFDMMGKSFGYTFKMPNGDMTFQGTKQ
ncbi:MAG TPA: hypothetical protein VEP89_12785 [Draconibacterium sp.]|nr:hypothetical protein [Draconibacterium sp.]